MERVYTNSGELMDVVIQGLSFGLILAVLIGPVFFTLIQTSLEKGFLSGAFVALGIILSDIAYILVAYFGVARLFEEASFKAYLGYSGGIILVAFGLFSLFKKPKKINRSTGNQGAGNYLKCLMKGFLVNGLSPFVLIFWIGAVSIASAEHDFSQNGLITFFSTAVGTVFITDLIKAYLAGRLRTLVTERFLKVMNIIVGVALIIFGGRLMFYKF